MPITLKLSASIKLYWKKRYLSLESFEQTNNIKTNDQE